MTQQDEIEKAAEEFRVPPNALPPRTKAEQDILFAYMRGRKQGFIAGAEYAKQEERFRIVQILANLPEVSIENITWGEIARLIEAPEAEK